VTRWRIAGRVRVPGALVAALAGLGLLLAACAPAPAGEYQGPSFAGGPTSPTSSKPESKLWFHAGRWWGVLWDTANDRYTIWRLDASNQGWANTGVEVDTRSAARFDALADGDHLYLASHVFAETAAVGAGSYVTRFSYDAADDGYRRDFQQAVNLWKTETLTVAKERTTEQLWTTWTQDRKVLVAATTSGDQSWGAPFVLPTSNADGLSNDDISSVIAFGSGHVGVMWSNQSTDTIYFATHGDGANATAGWSEEVAVASTPSNPNAADDHINLKTASDGRVFAATKTSNSSSSQPQILLLERETDGAWTDYRVANNADSHTRPIVVLDEEDDQVDVFATSPTSDGNIYRKTSSLDSISFPVAGKGVLVLDEKGQDDTEDGDNLNNATAAKTNVSSSTGSVVLSSTDPVSGATNRYWHYWSPDP